jgi:hypothetical protein
MLDDIGVDEGTDELSWTDADLDDALARTRARHSELLTRRKRRTTALAGLGALLVVGAGGLFALGAGGSGGSKQPATIEVADRPDVQPTVTAPSTVAPTTEVAHVGPPVGIGEAMSVRRWVPVVSVDVDEDNRSVKLGVACETAEDRVSDTQTTWSGDTLQINVQISTTRPDLPCTGTPLDVTVPVPAGVHLDRITVTTEPR